MKNKNIPPTPPTLVLFLRGSAVKNFLYTFPELFSSDTDIYTYIETMYPY